MNAIQMEDYFYYIPGIGMDKPKALPEGVEYFSPNSREWKVETSPVDQWGNMLERWPKSQMGHKKHNCPIPLKNTKIDLSGQSDEVKSAFLDCAYGE